MFSGVFTLHQTCGKSTSPLKTKVKSKTPPSEVFAQPTTSLLWEVYSRIHRGVLCIHVCVMVTFLPHLSHLHPGDWTRAHTWPELGRSRSLSWEFRFKMQRHLSVFAVAWTEDKPTSTVRRLSSLCIFNHKGRGKSKRRERQRDKETALVLVRCLPVSVSRGDLTAPSAPGSHRLPHDLRLTPLYVQLPCLDSGGWGEPWLSSLPAQACAEPPHLTWMGRGCIPQHPFTLWHR